MAISILNITPLAAASGNPVTCTIPATTAGSTLIIFEVCGNNDATLTSVTGGGGTWTLKQSESTNLSAWGLLTGVAAGTTTITFNLSTADGISVVIFEVAGISGVVDQNATIKNTASATTIASNTITTANAADLIIGAILGFPPSGTAPTVTPTSSGYTNQSTLSNSTSFRTFIQTGYQIVAATGTFGYNATTSLATTTAAYVIALQAATASSNFGDGFSDVL